MQRMKVAQVAKPNAVLEVIERDVPDPKPRQVRIKVQACGVCHSDMFTVAGAFPGTQYPRVPGHEVVGIIDAVGGRRARLEAGHARGCRLARRPLRALPLVSAWRLHHLRSGTDPRHLL